MAHSFYACLGPPIVVGVILTYQNLDPEYKTTAFFQMYFHETKNIWVNMVYSAFNNTDCVKAVFNRKDSV